MRRFTELYTALDETRRTGDKVVAMAAYFAVAPPADAAWALAFLSGWRPKRALPAARLRAWAAASAGCAEWLVDECQEAVGDLGETAALLLPPPVEPVDLPLHRLVEERLLPLPGLDDERRRALVERSWRDLEPRQRLVYHKLITGGFRVGAARRLVVRALSQASGVPADLLAHRLMGPWQPTGDAFARLVAAGSGTEGPGDLPYPFLLAHPLRDDPAALGTPADWQVEWKWDGIRAQLVRRADQPQLWSRGEELVGHRFPEVIEAAAALPAGTVLDGELLAWAGDRPRPFAALQRRLGRKHVPQRLRDEVGVALVAYDLLEERGQDLRAQPLALRRARLERLCAGLGPSVIRCSPLLPVESWEGLAALRAGARERGVEGLMLKRRDSAYGVGRVVGAWWKWKLDPFHIDAVLVYAQPGSGQRAGLFTDYTFAVWDEGVLVPVAKAYSGLSHEEIRAVDRFVRGHTRERFGPVRAVDPQLVFEIAFEGIQLSRRHRAGVALRFPRMARWRHDKPPEQADRLATLRELAAGAVATPV